MADYEDDKPVASQDEAAQPPDDGKRTVDEWAQMYFPAAASGAPHKERWKHAAAAALHRWALYEHDQNAPLRLSQSDYDAAIAAALTPNKQGAVEPHDAANYGEAK